MSKSATRVATGRSDSLFAADLQARGPEIRDQIRRCRVLAIGAAGSIGSNTIKVLLGFAPDVVHIVDQNENGLAELVRQLRSAPEDLPVGELRTLPLDYGSRAMAYFLDSEPPYDLVLNFAALKHVRSEKDPFSTLQMFDTNIVKQARLIRWLSARSFTGRYFSVSTDKAANPSSLMGATKRVMEHVMFDADVTAGLPGPITSARFANVAFSNGSLLQSFENRFARGEPLACPRDIRRFFVSLEESGEICALAATLLSRRLIGIPRLDPEKYLVPLVDIARAFIEEHGFTPREYVEEAAARHNAASDRAAGRWPLLLTPPDTAGEKPYEEFVARGESVVEVGLTAMQAVGYQPPSNSVSEMLRNVEAMFSNTTVGADLSKDRLKALVASLEPAFLEGHRDSPLNLDQRA